MTSGKVGPNQLNEAYLVLNQIETVPENAQYLLIIKITCMYAQDTSILSPLRLLEFYTDQ